MRSRHHHPHSRARARALYAIGAATLLLRQAPALAEVPASSAASASSPDAAAHFQRGVKLYEEADHRAALLEFRRAYELAPRASVLFNIGQCYFELHDYAGALNFLEKYLRDAGSQVAPERRTLVEQELRELRDRVAKVSIHVNVAGADIQIDDASIGQSPLAAPVLLSTGRHTLRAIKNGYSAPPRILDVTGGDQASVTLELLPERLSLAPVAPTSHQTPRSSESRAIPHRGHELTPLAVVSFGLGIAGLGVGTVFGISAIVDKSALDKSCVDNRCPTSAQSRYDALTQAGTASTIGFAAGGAAIGVGLILVLASGGSRELSPPPSASVSPFVGLTSAGVRGVF